MRDDRAKELYALEHEVLSSVSRQFTDVREARSFLDEVVSSDWFGRRWPDQAVPEVVRRGSGSTMSLAMSGPVEDGTILVAELDAATLLHELAHLCRGVEGGHDDQFVAVLLDLVRQWMGSHAYGAFRSAVEASGRWPDL